MPQRLPQTGAVLERLFVASTQSADPSGLLAELRVVANNIGSPEAARAFEQVANAVEQLATSPPYSMMRAASVQEYFAGGLTLLQASTTT